MKRDSFIFYRSFFESIQELEPETRCACYDAIIGYALDGTLPDVKGISKAIFTAMKPQIDANNKRYEDGCKGAEYGKLGGRPKKDKNPTGVIDKNPIGVIESANSKTPNENENENDNEILKEKEKKKNRSFEKPSIQDIADYCKERNNSVDAQTFFDFYESKGWMIGKEKMRDWKAAVRTWERRDRASPTKSNPFNSIPHNTYTDEELERLFAN